jgi:hypothetical protein
VTTLVTALPFLGFTVTATRQFPAFRPLNDERTTLQFLDEADATLSDTFEVERTFNLAITAIDFADVDFLAVTVRERFVTFILITDFNFTAEAETPAIFNRGYRAFLLSDCWITVALSPSTSNGILMSAEGNIRVSV